MSVQSNTFVFVVHLLVVLQDERGLLVRVPSGRHGRVEPIVRLVVRRVRFSQETLPAQCRQVAVVGQFTDQGCLASPSPDACEAPDTIDHRVGHRGLHIKKSTATRTRSTGRRPVPFRELAGRTGFRRPGRQARAADIHRRCCSPPPRPDDCRHWRSRASSSRP